MPVHKFGGVVMASIEDEKKAARQAVTIPISSQRALSFWQRVYRPLSGCECPQGAGSETQQKGKKFSTV